MIVDPREQFRSLVGETIGVPADQVTLFAKGRVALYAILRALDVGPGDEVILPAFTCVAVPNAILYAGARPVWVDIDPATLCVDPASVDRAITPRTKAILAQSTFGLSADLDSITTIASGRAAVIDDCAHGLGGRYNGKPNGATAPFSFFSTQWSKPVSTGLGGIAVDRDGIAADRLRELERSAVEPSAMRVLALRALLFGRDLAGNGRVLRGGRAIYRVLGRAGLVPGSSSQDELEDPKMPDGFLARLSGSQARLGADRIGRLAWDTERRRAIAHRYSTWLADAGRTAAAEPANVEHAFLRYPVRVTDRTIFLGLAERAGIDLGDWFVSPVHPVTSGLDRWDYAPGQTPNAERACREIANLPTHPDLGDDDVGRVLSFLSENADLIR
jgi:perosamine synthetase